MIDDDKIGSKRIERYVVRTKQRKLITLARSKFSLILRENSARGVGLSHESMLDLF